MMENRTALFIDDVTDIIYNQIDAKRINRKKLLAVNNVLVSESKNIDSYIESLEFKIENLEAEIQTYEDYKKQLGNHVVIGIESLAMQNKIEEFIEKELYSSTSFRGIRYEFIGSC